MSGPIFDLQFADLFATTLTLLLSVYPIWLPILLIVVFWNMWLDYIRTEYISEQQFVLLEIKLPKEITKSPAAMEIFYTALYQTGSATFFETYWKGKVRPWFSLEMTSFGGQVHFFIWTWEKFRNLIEAQLYAQYNNIEIFEVPDYTTSMVIDPVNHPLWITQYKLIAPDPYPIKTYIDYGLDRDPKEEFKIDPITSVIEYLGSLTRGEQVWIQIMIQAHKKEGFSEGRIIKKSDWKEGAMAEIKKIRDASVQGDSKFPNPTKGQQEKIAAIERSIQKWPFEVMIRGGYFATKEANQISKRISGLIGAFRQYSANDFNGFKLGEFTDYDFPWQDFRRIRRNAREREALDAYKKRSFFNPPYKHYRGKPFILNTEELATIYHFPGQVSSTPTFERIMSKKAEPPANLPI